MTKKLMLLAAGALAALAFAALPAGASAEEVEAHCSVAPCEGIVESTGNAVLTEDNGLAISCTKTTGTVTQAAATSKTVSVTLTFDGCTAPFFVQCQNEGTGTEKIVTNTMTGHLITVVKNDPTKIGILLTGINVTFFCGTIEKTVTGNIIGTITNPKCSEAATNHTISFTQSGAGQQSDKTYTGSSFDLLANGTTASQTGEAHINYAGGKTVTLTC